MSMNHRINSPEWVDKETPTSINDLNITSRQEFDFIREWLYNDVILKTEVVDPYRGKRIAAVKFHNIKIQCDMLKIIAFIIMRFLILYVNNKSCFTSKSKFTIGYTSKSNSTKDRVNFIVGNAIPLLESNGHAVPNIDIYKKILDAISTRLDIYGADKLYGLCIQAYMIDIHDKDEKLAISPEDVDDKIWEILNSSPIGDYDPTPIDRKPPRYPEYIKSLKPDMNPDPFIVADIETILDKVVEDNVEDKKILIQNVEDMDNEEYYETIKDMNNEEYNETIMDMGEEACALRLWFISGTAG